MNTMACHECDYTFHFYDTRLYYIEFIYIELSVCMSRGLCRASWNLIQHVIFRIYFSHTSILFQLIKLFEC